MILAFASGQVDARLLSTLDSLSACFSVKIHAIKTGHPMGPQSPAGVDNSHYYHRAADIVAVNSITVLTNEDAGELGWLGMAPEPPG